MPGLLNSWDCVIQLDLPESMVVGVVVMVMDEPLHFRYFTLDT